ncbi:glutaredoxin family protein [Salirhabdus salicampi]|uniref:glutaredoxin family protein n=1 Tax=Salirhabdus salicampi TaxID=476102 RepID=UPI0020C28C1B|nr:glutaredoxin family protein [Salirhabdus salicampi]MCP8617648.1 glutaredoxin family protein [Salirhabdus salicampi]
MNTTITLYIKERCPLCDEAKELLFLFRDDYDFTIEEIDIYQDPYLLEKYHLSIPVIRIKNKELDGAHLNYGKVEQLLKETIT